ncbi:TPA: heat-labile enterotoxin subunit alpha [Yersinia enterocolitica]|nr:heat-labile enterotoxin subunit alpha [Yersinia enterocolitica]HDX9052063.1 heat-labile enterotoxin subunit alpha [Yersinia enterocolitica]
MIKFFLFSIFIIFSHFSCAKDITKVYRAAIDSPENVKRAGGFYPRGMDGSRPNQPPSNINLWDHTRGSETGLSRHDSGYVSTTTSRGFAIRWVNSMLNHNGYVYYITATPNFIDVNRTLRSYSPYPEELEIAALGVIHWSQIIGWERVRGGVVGPFVPNSDYREGMYGNLASSGAQPQLAGFPAGHPAWRTQPWLTFAYCELKKELRSPCYPDKTAQDYGENMFWSSYRKVITRWLFVME